MKFGLRELVGSRRTLRAELLAILCSFATVAVAQIDDLGGGSVMKPYPSSEDARACGPGHFWQGGGGAINPYSHAKNTRVNLIGWRTRGGTPLGLSLNHSSRTIRGGNLGGKWRHSYEVDLLRWIENGTHRACIVWGDHRIQMFRLSGNSWVSDDGYRDSLQAQGQNFLLTTHGQTKYLFEPTTGPAPSYPRRYRMFSIVDRTTTINLTYDAGNRILRVDEPAGRSLRFRYDDPTHPYVTTIRFFHGNVQAGYWGLLLDPASRQLIRVEFQEVTTGGVPTIYYEHFAYDSRGNVVDLTDILLNHWKYTYSGNRLTSIQYPLNAMNQRVLLSANGLQRSITDPVGIQTTYEYDAMGRIVRGTDGGGFSSTYEYNDPDYGYGNSRTVSPTGNQTRYNYDARGNVVQVTDPAGNQTDCAYDVSNNLTDVVAPLVTDAFGNVNTFRHRTEFRYDGLNRRIETRGYTSTNSFVSTLYSHDAMSNVIQVTNPLNRTWNYTYDGNGNLMTATTPMGRVVRWIYDGVGKTAGFTVPNAVIDPSGMRIELNRDEWGRLLGTDAPGVNDRRYEYDGLSRLVRAQDTLGTTQYTYDGNGRRVMETRGPWIQGTTYYPNGQVQTVVEDSGTGPWQRLVTYNNRGLAQMLVDNNASTTFQYDADGQLVQRNLGNGGMSQYGYANGRLQTLVQRTSGGAPMLNSLYTYQADGRVARVDENGVNTRYQYDALGRLVRENRNAGPLYDHQWMYDALGNRVHQDKGAGQTTTYGYDLDGNIIQAIPAGQGAETYQYDPNGRLVRRARNNGSEIYQFGYSEYGEMIDIDRWNGASFDNNRNYEYDALGRRVRRDVWVANTIRASHIFWSGLDRIDSVVQGQPSTEIPTFAGGLLRSWDSQAGEMWAGTDAFGDQRVSTDGAGAFTNLYSIYNSFGETVATTGPTTPWQYGADSGMRNEGDAGLIASILPDSTPSLADTGNHRLTGDGLDFFFYDPKIGLSLPSGPKFASFGESDEKYHLTGPGIPPTLDSFFDVFVEVDLPGIRDGLSWQGLLPAIQRFPHWLNVPVFCDGHVKIRSSGYYDGPVWPDLGLGYCDMTTDGGGWTAFRGSGSSGWGGQYSSFASSNGVREEWMKPVLQGCIGVPSTIRP